jgi:membrane protein
MEASTRRVAAVRPGPPPPEPSRARHAWERVRRFVKLVYEKAGDDDIFFIAGAISFNVIVAFVPFVLAVLAIAGTVLRLHSADPGGELERFILNALPPVGAQPRRLISQWLDNLILEGPKLIGLGTIVFMWLATRLVGTLRTALRQIFDVGHDRGIITGKFFDLEIVLVVGVLFAANVTLTLGLTFVFRAGVSMLDFLGAGRGQISLVRLLWTRTLAFLLLWATYLLIYRYLPARHTSWRTSITAATFTSLVSEALKEGFAWYVISVANYSSTYGNLASLIVLVLWIYYTALVFVLGGEIAQVAALQRIRRRQKQRLA